MPSRSATNVVYVGSSKSSSHSAARLLERRRADLREDGREELVLAQRQLRAGERVEVLAPSGPHGDPLGRRRRFVERLADRGHVLVAEAEAEPGVDQLGIRGGNHRVVRRPTLRDPGRGSQRHRDRGRARAPRRRGRRARPTCSGPRSRRAARRRGIRRPRRRGARRRPTRSSRARSAAISARAASGSS